MDHLRGRQEWPVFLVHVLLQTDELVAIIEQRREPAKIYAARAIGLVAATPGDSDEWPRSLAEHVPPGARLLTVDVEIGLRARDRPRLGSERERQTHQRAMEVEFRQGLIDVDDLHS